MVEECLVSEILLISDASAVLRPFLGYLLPYMQFGLCEDINPYSKNSKQPQRKITLHIINIRT